jgi:DNA-binding response OmpR family regulator
MPDPSPKTVLILEEEEHLRVLVRDLLAQRGFRVLEAGGAQEALRLCQENRKSIDLLITDLVLPLMTGVDLAKLAAPWQPTMKALYLEDHSESTMISRGIPLTGLEYLAKPVKLKSLMAKVEEMVGRASGNPAPPKA